MIHTHLRRALRRTTGLVVAGTVTALLSTLAVAPAQAVDATPEQLASTWLESQLTSGLVHNDQFGGFDDYGLSLDLGFALAAVGQEAVVSDIATAMEPNVRNYTGSGSEVYAGSAAKLLVFAQTAGADPTSYGGYSLVQRLNRRVSTKTVIKGRIQDRSPYPDYANVVGQALAARGLGAAGTGKARSALDFLLKQQCRDGYFRLNFTKKKTAKNQSCNGGNPNKISAPDTDATAFAVIELLGDEGQDVQDQEEDRQGGRLAEEPPEEQRLFRRRHLHRGGQHQQHRPGRLGARRDGLVRRRSGCCGVGREAAGLDECRTVGGRAGRHRLRQGGVRRGAGRRDHAGAARPVAPGEHPGSPGPGQPGGLRLQGLVTTRMSSPPGPSWRRLLTAAALVAAAVGAPASPASAAVCTGDTGVTVVVDYRQLGGGVVKKCAAGGDGASAVSLFPDNGFPLTYVQRQPGFVCRVGGLPDPDTQACVNTPPADAYWGLFWADGKAATWKYSTLGVGGLTLRDGQSVGFSWQSSTSSTPPGVAPPAPNAPATSPSPSSKPSSSPKPSSSAVGGSASPDVTASPTASGSPSTSGSASPSATSSGSARQSESASPSSAVATEPSASVAAAAATDGSGPDAGTDRDGLSGWTLAAVLAALVSTGALTAYLRRRPGTGG